MVNPKYIVVFSCVGLFLSFIICLISHISAGTMFIRALIFAVVFGILGVAVQIVFNKFLLTGDGFGGDISGGSKAAATTGTVINISVGDDKLPDDDAAPKFIVKNTEPVTVSEGAAPADYSAPRSAQGEPSAQNARASASAENSGFKPVDLSSVTTKSDSLDELPDMADVSVSGPSESAGLVSSVSAGVPDTVFESGSSSGGGNSSSSSGVDGALAAKAISTMLANDN